MPTDLTIIVKLKHDRRYEPEAKQKELADMVADRTWRIDGVLHGTAEANVMGPDQIIISRAEYDELKDFKRRQETFFPQESVSK